MVSTTGRVWSLLTIAIAIATAIATATATATAEAPPADAEVVRRCVGADGAVSWQSAACDDGAREVAVRVVVAATATPAMASEPRAMRTAPVRRGVAIRRPATDAARARCAAARREADARRERDWNRLGFRERSQLDAGVARACAR